jgi:sugar transferase EpsL
MRSSAAKRILDVVVAGTALVVLAIPMAAIALLVRLRMGSPILHRSVRPGLGGRPFTMLKFRTMRDVLDSQGRPLSDRDRVTPLGRVLRRTSLDELPELLNVLRGEMSLVGPRPLLTSYLPLYTGEQARRHDVRPGITGWAQINGRNALDWDRKLELDVWYVDHRSLALDVRILCRTVGKVLRRDGMSAEGDLDVPAFAGSMSHVERSARG